MRLELLAEVLSKPWAVERQRFQTMAGVFRRLSTGVAASHEVMAEIEAAKAARAVRQAAMPKPGAGIAVLPLYGVLAQRANMIDDVSGSGGTSTQMFTAAFRDALVDDSVGGIIIDIDSPGGSVFGTGELSAEIFAARGTKPVFGYVNSLCASAAYWIGSQCDQLFATAGGQVGSIGVYMQHTDMSKALDQDGIAVEYIYAGEYKVEGNSAQPLSSDGRDFMQSQVDAYYSMFTSAVAKGRGVPIARVCNGMGQGRCLMAGDALKAGMIDGITTFDGVVSGMAKAIKAGPTVRPTQNTSGNWRRERALAEIGVPRAKLSDQARLAAENSDLEFRLAQKSAQLKARQLAAQK